MKSQFLRTLFDKQKRLFCGSLTMLVKFSLLRTIAFVLIKTAALIIMMAIWMFFLIEISNSLAPYFISGEKILQGVQVLDFDINRYCEITFFASKANSLKIDRVYAFTKQSGRLKVIIEEGFRPYETCSINIFLKEGLQFLFNCKVGCSLKNDLSTSGSFLNIVLRSVYSEIFFNNITLNNMVLDSSKGFLTLKDVGLINSLISVQNYVIRVINDFPSDFIVHFSSSNVNLFTDETLNTGARLDINFCDVYTSCLSTFEALPFDNNTISDVEQKEIFNHFFFETQSVDQVVSLEDHYKNLYYSRSNLKAESKNLFYLQRSTSMFVHQQIYETTRFKSIELFNKLIFENHYLFPFNIVKIVPEAASTYDINKPLVFSDASIFSSQHFGKEIVEVSRTFFKKSSQQRVAIITFMPLNITSMVLEKDQKSMADINLDFVLDSFTGSYEKFVVNIPIIHSSYSVINEFVNMLFLLNKTKEAFGTLGSPKNYEVLLRISNPEIFYSIKNSLQIVNFDNKTSDDLLKEFYEIRWSTGHQPVFWLVKNTYYQIENIVYTGLPILLAIILVILLAFIHVKFVERSILKFNDLKYLYNINYSTNYQPEMFHSNNIVRYFSLIFMLDYNQVKSHYYHALLGKFENSVSIFYQKIFLRVQPAESHRLLKSQETFKYTDFIKIYQDFCFSNDLIIAPIENFVNEAKLKEFNHQIISKESIDFYIFDVQILPKSANNIVHFDFSEHGDSLDAFITTECSFFTGKHTKLKSFIAAYQRFCKSHGMHIIEFNKEYLQARYQLQIQKKPVLYIARDDALNLNKECFTFRVKSCRPKILSNKSKSFSLKDFSDFNSFRYEIKKEIFFFCFDIMCFQIFAILIFSLPHGYSIIGKLVIQLYKLQSPEITKGIFYGMIVCVVLLFLYLAKIFKRASLLNSPAKASNPFQIIFFILIWANIYYEKYQEFHFLIFYSLKSFRIWQLCRFELAASEIDMFLLCLINIIWVIYLILLGINYHRVKSSLIQKHRTETITNIQCKFPRLATIKPIPTLNNSTVEKVANFVNHLKIIKNMLQNNGQMDDLLFESLMVDFFQELSVSTNDNIVKLALLINKRNVQASELVDAIVNISINQIIFDPYNNHFSIAGFKENVELLKKFICELIYMKATNNITFSSVWLRTLNKTFFDGRFEADDEPLQAFFNELFFKRPLQNLKNLNIENASKLREFNQTVVNFSKPSLNYWLDGPDQISMSVALYKKNSLPEVQFLNRRLYSLNRNVTFKKLLQFKIINFQAKTRTQDLETLLDNQYQCLKSFLNQDEYFDKNKKDVVELVHFFYYMKMNNYSFEKSYTRCGIAGEQCEKELTMFYLFLEACANKMLGSWVHYNEDGLATNSFLRYFCEKFEMSTKEFFGMVHLLNGIHSDYNLHYIRSLCKNHGFADKSSFCVFIYNLLNYTDPPAAYCFRPYIPFELIEMFIYLKKGASRLSEESLNMILENITHFQKCDANEIKVDMRARNITKLTKLKFDWGEESADKSDYIKMLYLLIDLADVNNDKMLIYEMLLKCFPTFTQEKIFAAFFKELCFYVKEINLVDFPANKLSSYQRQKFLFTLTDGIKSQPLIELLISLMSKPQEQSIKAIYSVVYPSRYIGKKLLKNCSDIWIRVKQEILYLAKVSASVKNFKESFEYYAPIKNGTMLGAFIENMIVPRVKYSFEETSNIIYSAFTMCLKLDSFDLPNDNKFNDLLVCLSKSILMQNPFYLHIFFSKYHPKCILINVLLGKYFDTPDTNSHKIYQEYLGNLRNFTNRQKSIFRLYFLITKKITVTAKASLHRFFNYFNFDSSYIGFLEIYLGLKCSWKDVLGNIHNNALRANTCKQKNVLLFKESNLVQSLFSLSNPTTEHLDFYSDSVTVNKIIPLKYLKDSICFKAECASQANLNTIFSSKLLEKLWNDAQINKDEIELALNFVQHTFDERHISAMFQKLQVEFAKQNYIANLLFIIKKVSRIKSNSPWSDVFLYSDLLKSLKLDPLFSWLTIFSLKGDCYSLIKLLKANLYIFDLNGFMQNLIYSVLFLLMSEQKTVERESATSKCKTCPKEKLVNCSEYYYAKLKKSDGRLLNVLKFKQAVSNESFGQNINNKYFPHTLSYILIAYNLEEKFKAFDHTFIRDFVSLTHRAFILKCLKAKSLDDNSLDHKRIQRLLSIERKNLRKHFREHIRPKMLMDLDSEHFIEFSAKQFKVKLSKAYSADMYYAYNCSLIKYFLSKIMKKETDSVLVRHLHKCLNNKKFCCWRHSLFSMKDDCARQLFLLEENYVMFISYFVPLTAKMLYDLHLKIFPSKDPENRKAFEGKRHCTSFKEPLAQEAINIIVRIMAPCTNKATTPKCFPKPFFIKMVKLILSWFQCQYYAQQSTIFTKDQKNLLAKILEYVFANITTMSNFVSDDEHRLSKDVFDITREQSMLDYETLVLHLSYFKVSLGLMNESANNFIPSNLSPKKRKPINLFSSTNPQTIGSKYSKLSVKHFLSKIDGSPSTLEFLKYLCAYEKSYLRLSFEHFPQFQTIFPQYYFDMIYLLIDFGNTNDEIDKTFMKALIKKHFDSNAQNFVDLLEFITYGHRKGQFTNYIADDESEILCKVIFDGNSSEDSFIRYCMGHYDIPSEIAQSTWTLAMFIRNRYQGEYFSKLSMYYHLGKDKEEAIMLINGLKNLALSREALKDKKLKLLNFLKPGFLGKEDLKNVKLLIKIVESTIDGDFSIFTKPKEKFLSIFFNNLLFDNVEVLKIFPLMDALRNNDVSLEDTSNIFYQLISYSQYDLVHANLSGAKGLLTVLKSLLTKNYFLAMDFLKSSSFKKEYAFLLSFLVYLKKVNMTIMHHNRSDFEDLFPRSRDYLFLQLLKIKYIKNSRHVVDDDNNLSTLIKDQQFLQDYLYNLDFKWEAQSPNSLAPDSNQQLLKIESLDKSKFAPQIDIINYPTDDRRLHYFFTENECLYTEGHNLNDQQINNLLSFDSLFLQKATGNFEKDSETKNSLHTIFNNCNLLKIEDIYGYFMGESKALNSSRPNRNDLADQSRGLLSRQVGKLNPPLSDRIYKKKLLKLSSTLAILFERDINLQLKQLIAYFYKEHVFNGDFKASLTKNFEKLDFNFICEIAKKFSNSAHFKSNSLVRNYCLTKFLKYLNLEQQDINSFFFMHRLLCKEDNLVWSWLEGQTHSVNIFNEIKFQYQKLINNNISVLAASEFVKRQEELTAVKNMLAQSREKICSSKELFNSYIFKVLECVQPTQSKNLELLEQLFYRAYDSKISEKFHIKIFFQRKRRNPSYWKPYCLKEDYEVLIPELEAFVVKKQLSIAYKHTALRNFHILWSCILYKFAFLYFITCRFGKSIPGVELDYIRDEMIPRLIICKLTSLPLFLPDIKGDFYQILRNYSF